MERNNPAVELGLASILFLPWFAIPGVPAAAFFVRRAWGVGRSA